MIEIINGNALTIPMRDNSVDAIVTDPPYGLGFLGASWDHGVPEMDFWVEALRVAKPGAWLLAFGGTRTHHRLMTAIEDAGWEIRDVIMWIYGTGWPKSLNVANAIDKLYGAGNRGHVTASGGKYHPTTGKERAPGELPEEYKARTEQGKRWENWGTALKPAWEPIIVARVPIEGTVAENVLKWGTGGINVDGCRVKTEETESGQTGRKEKAFLQGDGEKDGGGGIHQGRFPSNLVIDGSDEVTRLFPITTSGKPGVIKKGVNSGAAYGKESRPPGTPMRGFGDSGSASRLFYNAKATKQDRNEGLTDVTNTHPTVKPTSLMRYLVRLVTPPHGLILDTFCGSGSTGKAALLEGFNFIGLDLMHKHCIIARDRCAWTAEHRNEIIGKEKKAAEKAEKKLEKKDVKPKIEKKEVAEPVAPTQLSLFGVGE